MKQKKYFLFLTILIQIFIFNCKKNPDTEFLTILTSHGKIFKLSGVSPEVYSSNTGLNKVIGKLPTGSLITGENIEEDWIGFIFIDANDEKLIGWLKAKDLNTKNSDLEKPLTKFTVVADSISVYEKPSLNSSEIESLKFNSEFKISFFGFDEENKVSKNFTDTWYMIVTSNKIGFILNNRNNLVPTDYITNDSLYIHKEKIYLKSEPKDDGKNIIEKFYGEELQGIKLFSSFYPETRKFSGGITDNPNWRLVNFKDKPAFISKEDFLIDNNSIQFKLIEKTDIYLKPDSNTKEYATLEKDFVIRVLGYSEDLNFAHFPYDGQKCWIKTDKIISQKELSRIRYEEENVKKRKEEELMQKDLEECLKRPNCEF